MRIPFRHPAWALIVDGKRAARDQDRGLIMACLIMTQLADWRGEKHCRVETCHVWTFWP